MKVKELIKILLLKNQEADVIFSFNGLTNSSELLSITCVTDDSFVKINDELYQLSEIDLEDDDVLQEQQAFVNLYSNREKYFPSFNF